MRRISTKTVIQAVRDLSISANLELGEDVIHAFEEALEKETSPSGKAILAQLIDNAQIAKEEKIPICQDTGLVTIFVDLGQEVSIVGGDFKAALEQGIREGYSEGFLRKSVCHPFTRKNTGDNTPLIAHIEIVPGDKLKICVVPKGGGSENMSRVFMLPPSAGWQGVKEHVVRTVNE
ncbi:MAG TPA: fumarate hydratase, partial [Desulfobacteraceae bacterium]|nr:fumarate hydratase [Desulfobacteraceae bacterium]